MSSRVRELILELMLLRERFSARDISSAARVLVNGKADPALREILELLEGVDERSRTQAVSQASPEDAISRRDRFLRSIKRQSKASDKRLLMIAKKLGISLSLGRREEMVNVITSKLSEMDEETLNKFLRPYKSEPSPDKNYLGLANYLIHNNE